MPIYTGVSAKCLDANDRTSEKCVGGIEADVLMRQRVCDLLFAVCNFQFALYAISINDPNI